MGNDRKGIDMDLNLSKTRKALLIVALMLTAIPFVADGVIIPISNNLYEAFPDAVGVVNFILSGPQIFVAIASLAAAPLMRMLDKKTLLVVFGIVCAVSLVFGAAIENAYYMAVCRGIAGFSMGIINVVGLAFIAQIFTDEKVYANLMGAYNAIMSLGGTLLAFLSGMVAVSGWQNSYLLFIIMIPCALAFMFFIPKMGKDSADVDAAQEAKAVEAAAEPQVKQGFGMQFWAMMLVLFLYLLAAMGCSYFVSVYVAENALGNESLAGTASSLFTLGSFIFALVFGTMYGKLHRGVNVIALACTIVMLVLMVFTRNPIVLCVAMVVGGGSYGFAYAFALTHMPDVVPASKVDSGMAVIGFVVAIASFVATYFVTFLMGFVGSFTAATPILLVIAVVALAVEIVSGLAERKATANA